MQDSKRSYLKPHDDCWPPCFPLTTLFCIAVRMILSKCKSDYVNSLSKLSNRFPSESKNQSLTKVFKALPDLYSQLPVRSLIISLYLPTCSFLSGHSSFLAVPQTCQECPYLRAFALSISCTWIAPPPDIT